MAGKAVTVERGLYRRDLVVVTERGTENLNYLHEGLSWT